MASPYSSSYSTRPPLFNGTNFAFWKIRMNSHLMSLGMEVWKIVVDGYKIPSTLPTDEEGKKHYYNNARAMNVIQGGLAETKFVKVMQLEFAKEIWGKLVNNYEGYEKVKFTKCQSHRMKFEILRMNEDENIVGFYIKVDETIQIIKGLG
jgi:hypothetical protein